MNREEFDQLVRQVEQGIGRRPAALKWRTGLLALLGYAGLLIELIVIFLIAAGFFLAMFWTDSEGKLVCAILGTLVLAGGGFAALRTLMVKLPLPRGRVVTAREVPALFATLAELQRELHSAPFHQVLIDTDCNAGVVQVPRLGLLGWPRNYLILGLPLLEGLSPEEMRAVLAHEFTHLSRAHGRFSHWLYRLRRSWEEIFKQFSKTPPAGQISLRPVIVKYVEWFWPRFNAHAFVLSRSNEYEADGQAARLAGAAHNGAALSRLTFLTRQLEKDFWPGTWEQANTLASPPGDVFSRLRDVLRGGPSAEERARWMQEALQVKTNNNDTHPSLTERLAFLNLDPAGHFPETTPRVTAAEAYLGPALETIRRDVQQHWQKEIADTWKQRHARATSLTHRLSSLEQAVPANAADADSLWDKAQVLLNLRSNEESVEPLLRQILALRPDHRLANYHLGRVLLEAGKAEGETFLDRVMAEDDESVPHASSLLHQHYRRLGRTDKLRELDARMDRYEKNLAASRTERTVVTAGDPVIPHGLMEAELHELQKVLATESELENAHLARKELRHFPTQKLFLLAIRRRPAWHRLPNQERDQALVNRLIQKVRLPGRLLVFPSSGNFGALATKLRTLPHSEVYHAGTPVVSTSRGTASAANPPPLRNL